LSEAARPVVLLLDVISEELTVEARLDEDSTTVGTPVVSSVQATRRTVAKTARGRGESSSRGQGVVRAVKRASGALDRVVRAQPWKR
jgi:hypothetical protein